jgi:hypothetical protein
LLLFFLPQTLHHWSNKILSPSKINDMFDFIYVYQYTTLTANIFNYLLLQIIKIVYFENTIRDKSNNISYVNICIYYILVEKYGQSKSNK